MAEATAAQLFEPARQFLREHLDSRSDESDYDRRYRFEHCLRVAEIGRQVADAEGLDSDLLALGCLLHDVGKFDAEKPVDHGRAGALIAVDFLRDQGLPEEQVRELGVGIAMHVDDLWQPRDDGEGTGCDRYGRPYFDFNSDPNFGPFDGNPSVLARSISDCDNIDRFGAYRIADTLHYFDFLNKEIPQQREIAARLKNVERLYDLECATETAQEMWIDRIDMQAEFYTRLHAEIR